MYDLKLQDPERADPVVVLDYWRNGFMSNAEIDQLQSLLTADVPDEALAIATSIQLQPTSEAVAGAVSVYLASLNYWTNGGAIFSENGKRRTVHGCSDDPECLETIRRILGDALGGALGTMMGGPISGAVVGAGLSIAFTIQEGSWPPAGDDNVLPPAPCGGPTFIGPCP